MNIIHNKEEKKFEINNNEGKAYLSYIISNNSLDVRHTFVPNEMRGQGIAAILVKAAYDFAIENQLKPVATCSYAVVWLQRHPAYQGTIGDDYAGEGTCAL
ncbi:MAG: GNAT family N-acetyltransferase [Bacteroidales bacterium]